MSRFAKCRHKSKKKITPRIVSLKNAFGTSVLLKQTEILPATCETDVENKLKAKPLILEYH